MKKAWLIGSLFLLGIMAADFYRASAEEQVEGQNYVETVARGKYLVKIAGCNDCHTPEYLLKNGDVPEERWLTGDSLGWNGPWGTTYAANLRMLFQTITEDEWVTRARQQQMRPPMPWHVLRELTESDLRAIYLYIHQLGVGGVPAPDYLAPGEVPKTPYFTLIVPPEE